DGNDGAALGSNVVLSGGVDNPRVLAHELVHVAQNEVGGASRTGESRPGDASEREAQQLGERALRGENVRVSAAPTGQVAFVGPDDEDGDDSGDGEGGEGRESPRQTQQPSAPPANPYDDDQDAARERVRRDAARGRGAIDRVSPGASTTDAADIGRVPEHPHVTPQPDTRTLDRGEITP